jgi:hypothetical protein
MKKLFLILFLLCFLLLGTSAGILFYTQYIIFDMRDIPMDVTVSRNFGFNLGTDGLHFGKVTTPGNVERKISVHNQYAKPLRVTVQTSGEISGWVYANEYNPIFQPDELRNITMGINVPENTSYGNYSGIVRLLFTRVLI